MFSTLRKRATFANITAFTALIVALSTGTAYAQATIRSGDIVNGQVKTVDLGNNAVTTGKIKSGQVTAPDLGPGAVTSASVADGSLGVADLGNDSVGSVELQVDSVNATEIADGSIDGGEIIDNSLGAGDLAPGSVGTSEVADGTLTGTDIASNSITTADLAGTDVNGTISLGAGAVPVGQCKYYDITVGGALADQAIVISARATLPAGQLLYGVEVPSSGHAIMAACNLSGTSWDALASFPIRVVTFG